MTMNTKQQALLWHLVGLGVLGLLLGVWAAVSHFQLISRIYLPSPAAVWKALTDGFESGRLLAQTYATLGRMLMGWLISCVVGVALGALIGMSSAARAYIQPTIELLRPLPSSAIVPVAIALIGLNETMVLTVICFGTLWPVLLATIHGTSALERRLTEVGRVLEMPRHEFLFKIALPNALPDILAGMKLSISIALILTVVGEMISSSIGLGQGILFASRAFRTPELYAGVVLLGAIGYLSSTLLGFMEARLLRYRG